MPTGSEFRAAASLVDAECNDLSDLARDVARLRDGLDVVGGSLQRILDEKLTLAKSAVERLDTDGSDPATELRVRAVECDTFTAEVAAWRAELSEYWRFASQSGEGVDIGSPPAEPSPDEPWIEAG